MADLTPSNATAESLVAQSEGSEAKSVRAAIAELITEWCATGPVPIEEINGRVREYGFDVSPKTVQRAAKLARVVSTNPESPGGKRSYRFPDSLDTNEDKDPT